MKIKKQNIFEKFHFVDEFVFLNKQQIQLHQVPQLLERQVLLNQNSLFYVT